MTDAVGQILSQVSSLTQQERAELAYALVCSLGPIESDDDVAAAWDEELNRRLDQVLRNEVEGIPAEQVFEKLRRRQS
ncbi:MAG: addiction module protein [Planctomycetes bacterium]|nr:addiction module protein [Planctomycetota bacterium]